MSVLESLRVVGLGTHNGTEPRKVFQLRWVRAHTSVFSLPYNPPRVGLSCTVWRDGAQVSGWRSRVYCYNDVCGPVGPTIELVPGDQFSLTLVNNLGANPTGEDTTMNSMHSPNTTNLHTHGLHIDPVIDTIFHRVSPGASHVYNYEVSVYGSVGSRDPYSGPPMNASPPRFTYLPVL